MMDIFPGQLVVCIDGNFHPTVWEWVNEVPIEGRIYTVRTVMRNNRHAVTGKIGPGLSLVEIPGRMGRGREVFWLLERFRPLDVQENSDATNDAKTLTTTGPAPFPLAPARAEAGTKTLRPR